MFLNNIKEKKTTKQNFKKKKTENLMQQ